jgi:hypothetical protein
MSMALLSSPEFPCSVNACVPASGTDGGTGDGEAIPKSTLTMKLDNNRRCWLAAYTRSRYEHEVARQLGQKNLEHLLPTYNKMRRFEIPNGTGRFAT